MALLLVAVSAVIVFVVGLSQRKRFDAATLFMEADAKSICQTEFDGRQRGSGNKLGLPVVHILGGSPLQFDYNWAVSTFPVYGTPKPAWFGRHLTLCVEENGMLTGAFSVESMHTRGSSSAFLPKHSFDLQLHGAEKSLLGLPKAKKLILNGVFFDTSFVRNPLSFAIYRAMGGWAPQTVIV
jgi:hypothetical protein